MSAVAIQGPGVAGGTTPQALDDSAKGRLASANVTRLTPADHQDIERFSKQLEAPLKVLARLTERNTKLREQIAEISFEEPKGLLARCAAWITARFTSKENLPPTRDQLELKLAENIQEIRKFTQRVIQPSINRLRNEYEGRTFVRTKDTPRPLVLASVPSEKVGKIPTHAALFEAITHLANKTDQPGFTVVSRDGDNSMTITRRTQDGYEETIRLSYRREGKVTAEILGPYGAQGGSFWNDDAFNLVRAFAKGRTLTFKPAKFKEYTVV